MRLSDIRPKTGEKWIFGFFSHFWAYAGQPHDHTGWVKSMPFASINPTNPRTNPWKFHEKILRIGGAGKWVFFWGGHFESLSRPFWIFFCFISLKNAAHSYEVAFFSALWMVLPESWKRSCPNFYAHDCSLFNLNNFDNSPVDKGLIRHEEITFIHGNYSKKKLS